MVGGESLARIDDAKIRFLLPITGHLQMFCSFSEGVACGE
jgi:hypothetical protein